MTTQTYFAPNGTNSVCVLHEMNALTKQMRTTVKTTELVTVFDKLYNFNSWSPDSTRFTVSSNDDVIVFDLHGTQNIIPFLLETHLSPCWSPDSRFLFCAFCRTTQVADIWDTHTTETSRVPLRVGRLQPSVFSLTNFWMTKYRICVTHMLCAVHYTETGKVEHIESLPENENPFVSSEVPVRWHANDRTVVALTQRGIMRHKLYFDFLFFDRSTDDCLSFLRRVPCLIYDPEWTTYLTSDGVLQIKTPCSTFEYKDSDYRIIDW